MDTITCRCGDLADCGTVDLCDFLCFRCYQDFDEWVTANRAELGRSLVYSDWPGRKVVAA